MNNISLLFPVLFLINLVRVKWDCVYKLDVELPCICNAILAAEWYYRKHISQVVLVWNMIVFQSCQDQQCCFKKTLSQVLNNTIDPSDLFQISFWEERYWQMRCIDYISNGKPIWSLHLTTLAILSDISKAPVTLIMEPRHSRGPQSCRQSIPSQRPAFNS